MILPTRHCPINQKKGLWLQKMLDFVSSLKAKKNRLTEACLRSSTVRPRRQHALRFGQPRCLDLTASPKTYRPVRSWTQSTHNLTHPCSLPSSHLQLGRCCGALQFHRRSCQHSLASLHNRTLPRFCPSSHIHGLSPSNHPKLCQIAGHQHLCSKWDSPRSCHQAR